MAYPPYLTRLTNFLQAQNAGADISVSGMDGEYNQNLSVLNEVNRRLRLITSSSGALINIASQISQALVGTYRATLAGGETTVTTTIAWDSAMAVGNTSVVVNGLALDPTTYSVADNGGFLEVTTPALDPGFVVVGSFTQGAGIEARLLDTGSAANGANMVGVQDVGGYFVSATVEGALIEVYESLAALIASLGIVANIWTANGTDISGGEALGPFLMGSQQIKNMADATDPQDAATLAQLLSFTQNLDVLLAQFIQADGSVDFTGDQSMDGHKLTDVGTPTAGGDATNKTYVDATVATASNTSLAINGLKTSTLRGTLTGPLDLDESATDEADADQTSAPNTVTVHTITGVPKPGAASHVANRQYVDEQIAAVVGGSTLISPYAVQTLGHSLDVGDLDGPITNMGIGGVLATSDLTITNPQVLTADTYVFVDGDVTINDTITATNKRLEIYATGTIDVTAAIVAGDIRLRAGGDITISDTITGSGFAGVIAVNTPAAFNISGNLTAPLVFIYGGTSSIISSTVTARLTNSGVIAANGLRWAATYGRNDYFPVTGLTSPFWANFDVDYLAKFAGVNATINGVNGQAGGGGASGGGRGGDTVAGGGHFGTAPQTGAARPYLYPAAPGGSGAGSTSSRPGQVGGGVILVRVSAGDLDLTGSTLTASGASAGVETGGNTSGGGGGGTVKVSASGTITEGTISARGGSGGGGSSGNDGRPGGGGIAYFVATAYAGVQTATATQGTAGASGAGGAVDGQSGAVTLTATEWDDLSTDGLLDR